MVHIEQLTADAVFSTHLDYVATVVSCLLPMRDTLEVAGFP